MQSLPLAHLTFIYLTTYTAFIYSYCCPLGADIPASHLAQLDTMETKAFKIIGISHDEADQSVRITSHHFRIASHHRSLSHHRQVGGLSVFSCLLSGFAPSSPNSVLCNPPGFFAGHMQSTSNPLLVNSQNPESLFTLHSFDTLVPPRMWNQLPWSL